MFPKFLELLKVQMAQALAVFVFPVYVYAYSQCLVLVLYFSFVQFVFYSIFVPFRFSVIAPLLLMLGKAVRHKT